MPAEMSFDNSVVGDERILKALYAVLSDKPIDIVTGFEQKMNRNRESIKELDILLNCRLIYILRAAINYVSVRDGLAFLMWAKRSNMELEAYSILAVTPEIGRLMDQDALKSALSQADELPAEWLVALTGEEDAKRDLNKSTANESSSLLNQLRSSWDESTST